MEVPHRLVGEIVAELETLGLRENTIVFVASDNGTESRFKGRRNGQAVTGGLYTLTEAGGNVVLIANAPSRIRAMWEGSTRQPGPCH